MPSSWYFTATARHSKNVVIHSGDRHRFISAKKICQLWSAFYSIQKAREIYCHLTYSREICIRKYGCWQLACYRFFGFQSDITDSWLKDRFYLYYKLGWKKTKFYGFSGQVIFWKQFTLVQTINLKYNFLPQKSKYNCFVRIFRSLKLMLFLDESTL